MSLTQLELPDGLAKSNRTSPDKWFINSNSTKWHPCSNKILSSSINNEILTVPKLLLKLRTPTTQASRNTSSFHVLALLQRLQTEGQELSRKETRRAKKRGRGTSHRLCSVFLLRISRSSRSTYRQLKREVLGRSLETRSAEVHASRRTSQ